MRFKSSLLKKAGPKICFAFSSGKDSIAILHFLKTRYPKLEITALHFNHKLREQNEIMQEAAQIFCNDFKIPLIVRARAASVIEERLSEASLRACRYKAFSGAKSVLTGHHLDDAVESYLMNCFNGNPEYLPIPEETKFIEYNFTVYRPFLISTVNQILDYNKRYNLEKYVVEDETNKETQYRRNWVRNQIVPEIQKYYNLRKIVKKRYTEK